MQRTFYDLIFCIILASSLALYFSFSFFLFFLMMLRVYVREIHEIEHIWQLEQNIGTVDFRLSIKSIS